jgi:murein DD-endopeptidase MepM/ murein hydrolase activator NlpD
MASPMQDKKYKVTTPFGVAGKRWSSGRHEGVDYAAPVGAIVVAPCDGKVVLVGQVWGAAFGQHSVLLKVEGGHLLFAHLSSYKVKVGQNLKAGDFIGKVGKEGNVTGPHLHMELQAGPRWKKGGGLDTKAIIGGAEKPATPEA